MPDFQSDIPTTTPREIAELFRHFLVQQPSPVILHLDADLRLLQTWGNVRAIDLPTLRTGQYMSEILPFMTGIDNSESVTFRCVDSGSGHALDVQLQPDRCGGSYLILLSVEESRRRREKLQQTTNELRLVNHRQNRLVEQLIEARSELDLRRREAEEALRLQTQFFASISHEFRTPLTSVIGYAQWLSNSAEEPARRQARAIVRAGQHMIALVDNLLVPAHLNDGVTSASTDSIDMRSLAEDISAIMAPLAADKGIAYAAYVDPAVPGLLGQDEMRLRQIMINLLGNAVKFTAEGSVNLSLSYEDGRLGILVSDTGPGIAAEDRERIYTAFARLKNAGGQAGAGLGLHITLQLVTLLGGVIELDSEPGHGSRFSVIVPAEKIDLPQEQAKRAAGHILLAEDDPDIAQLMELYLVRAGYRLTLVNNGRDAVTSATMQAPDAILLDLNMPQLDGLSAVRELRAEGYTGPVIALTGATLDQDRIRSIEAGFDGFVPKPVRMPELMSTLRTLIDD